ncbi:hypothetical protein ELQ35_09030 [Peribacillus cavernae]|uniref:Swarming motility protein SwrB n=1 Tax=Peribacillus cavernae TaxID=1674310 RepID=A0A433HQ51_9BACI|nr:hypothetical protein [Peribacillus cavernae]MDQ0217051.1 hypothetical protein [Peribacillus cavernae]RUQ30470.1 hypothetical protein ELQ35_09030 [Peribacillus cavernae]
MSAIIIFILFLVNIFTIFAVIILFLRQNRLMEAEMNHKESIAEIEEIMTAFIMEMKEENEELLKKLRKLKEPKQNAADHGGAPKISDTNSMEAPRAAEKQGSPDAAGTTEPLAVKVSRSRAVLAYKETALNEDNQTQSQHIFELYDKGMTAEEIAKSLNRGKTEIELLLKFRI